MIARLLARLVAAVLAEYRQLEGPGEFIPVTGGQFELAPGLYAEEAFGFAGNRPGNPLRIGDRCRPASR